MHSPVFCILKVLSWSHLHQTVNNTGLLSFFNGFLLIIKPYSHISRYYVVLRLSALLIYLFSQKPFSSALHRIQDFSSLCISHSSSSGTASIWEALHGLFIVSFNQNSTPIYSALPITLLLPPSTSL